MVKKEGRSVSEMMQEIFYMPTDEETMTLLLWDSRMFRSTVDFYDFYR